MDTNLISQAIECGKKYKELRMLILFGSRARGTARITSDWDFGYTSDRDFNPEKLYGELVLLLKTEKVDLVDLSRASALLRFRASEDGKLLIENQKGEFHRFLFNAIDFWCDAGPIIRHGYEDILGALQ